MSIKFDNVLSDLGIILNDCYAMISNYHGNDTTINLEISIYANKDAYYNGNRPVIIESLFVNISDLAKSNIFSYLYDKVINADDFQKYSPVVIELPYGEQPTITDNI